MGLHGTATNLKPTYRSEPPLSEADVFALLALGRTQEEAQIYQERQTQAGNGSDDERAAGWSVECDGEQPGGEAVWRGKREDRSGVCGNAGQSSARITVQQQLSRQMTATFATNVNASAQQLIQVQYDLNHNNSIVVTRDESGVFSVVYKLRQTVSLGASEAEICILRIRLIAAAGQLRLAISGGRR